MLGTISPESSWPGERDASRRDVELANEIPEPALLSDFKRALLASQDAVGVDRLMHIELCNRALEPKRFTYPAARLADFPQLPDHNDLVQLRVVFSTACQGHVFMSRMPLPLASRESIAPPMRLSQACLASVYTRRNPNEGRNLFLGGLALWSVMLEVDNSEARSIEMLAASALLTSYGVLGGDEAVLNGAALLLSSSATIVRRMRLNDPSQPGDILGPRTSSCSALAWCLWLSDIVQSLHTEQSSNFSSREIWTKMPASMHEFQDIYDGLLHDPVGDSSILPAEMTSQDDAVLLLMAIISDAIYLRRSLERLLSTGRDSNRHNPFVPLTPHTELQRMQNLLMTGLDKWHGKFQNSMTPEVMAFYHYCKLYIYCPELPALSRLSGYLSSPSDLRHSSHLTTNLGGRISDQAIRQAWQVLDSAASRPKTSAQTCSVWLPIVVFHAGLVIWANLTSANDNDRYGSKRALIAFKVELEGMPWPCCMGMAATLGRLMSI